MRANSKLEITGLGVVLGNSPVNLWLPAKGLYKIMIAELSA